MEFNRFWTFPVFDDVQYVNINEESIANVEPCVPFKDVCWSGI